MSTGELRTRAVIVGLWQCCLCTVPLRRVSLIDVLVFCSECIRFARGITLEITSKSRLITTHRTHSNITQTLHRHYWSNRASTSHNNTPTQIPSNTQCVIIICSVDTILKTNQFEHSCCWVDTIFPQCVSTEFWG